MWSQDRWIVDIPGQFFGKVIVINSHSDGCWLSTKAHGAVKSDNCFYLPHVSAQWIGGSPSILNKPKYDLVGGLEHVLFFHMLGTTKSQLTFIFFRGVVRAPTSCSVGLTEPAASGKHTWLPKIKTFTATASDAFPSYKPRQISGHQKGTRKSEEKKWRKRVPKAIQQWHPAIHWCGQCYT